MFIKLDNGNERMIVMLIASTSDALVLINNELMLNVIFSSCRTHNASKTSLMSANSLSSSIAMFAAPVLSNSTVSPQKFGTISSLTKREKKERKKRRNRTESKISLDSESICSKETAYVGNSQWYTVPVNDPDSVSNASYNSNTLMSPVFDSQDVSIDILKVFRYIRASKQSSL